MGGDNLVSVNFPNWVTVTLMAAVGLMVLATVAQAFHWAIPKMAGS